MPEPLATCASVSFVFYCQRGKEIHGRGRRIIDPPRLVKDVLKRRDLEDDAFITIKHGETVSFDDESGRQITRAVDYVCKLLICILLPT